MKVIIIDIILFIYSKNCVSKTKKIVAMYFGSIPYVKVNCMVKVTHKMGGRNGHYTIARFLLSI